MREISGLRDIVSGIDGVLVDQFGVLHDGRRAFPDALECLTNLHSLGMPVVAVTNSGKRSAPNLARLERLGFPSGLFHCLVSSGELTREDLKQRLSDGRLRAGDAVAVIARDSDASPLEGLDLRVSTASHECALLLILGVEPEQRSLEDYVDQVTPFVERGVPAICANPDKAMYSDGGVVFGAGVLADAYRSRGGEVVELGKPASLMFETALNRLGGLAASRVLMIGDSPEHDIAGAAAVGCMTLLIRSGVQSDVGARQAVADFSQAHLTW